MPEPYNAANSRPKLREPGWFRAFSRKLVPLMLRHRTRTLLVFFALVLGYELLERTVISRFGEPVNSIFQVVHVLIFLPLAGWLLLAVLDYYETERDQAEYDKDLQTELSQQLGDARSWDEITRRIVEWPHRVALLSNATLFIKDAHTKTLLPECACDWQGLVTVKPAGLPRLELHPINFDTGHPRVVTLPSGDMQYNLPVIFNEQQIGALCLDYPAGSQPEPAELNVLKNALPLIGLALEGALLQNLAAQQAEASQSERQQIAQHLHDTLAQNISYLRLKLDQLTGENAIREIGVVLQELERMRASADEAYQQVRSTLDELNLIQNEDLTTMVLRQAHGIGRRAGFELRSRQIGSPYELPDAVCRQILYIAREALHNIEKHAQATQVHIQFIWLDSELIVKFTDDGSGFIPPKQNEGHYGLWIMQQRAADIGGSVKVAPLDERGTEVTLWVPRLVTAQDPNPNHHGAGED